jgi:hypothetical protein
MEISMLVDFQILKNVNGNFVPISNKEATSVSIGGFGFEIGEHTIPFDWDAFSGSEWEKVFSFETGTGWFWNDYEISDCYDDEYEEIGIKKEDITAEFLASVSHIDEFFVDFDDADSKEQGIGWYAYNTDKAQYKINILKMSFLDLATQTEYPVKKEVLDAYNKGE